MAKDIYFLQNTEGTGLSPFDCWLCLRGIKTMALRVEKQQVVTTAQIDHVAKASPPAHVARRGRKYIETHQVDFQVFRLRNWNHDNSSHLDG